MKKLKFVAIAILFICFGSSVSASNYLSLTQETNQLAFAGENARYWITDVSFDRDIHSFVTQINFTVNWQWYGPGPAYPVYEVEVLDVSGRYTHVLHRLMDSAIGQTVGFKRYSVKIDPGRRVNSTTVRLDIKYGEDVGI